MILDFPEIQALLPHRGQLALLSKVLHFAPPKMEVEARVAEAGLFGEDSGQLHNAMPSWIGIELMAQGAAAYIGLLARKEGRPVPEAGYLLGTRKFTAQVNAFPAGAVLRVQTEVIYRDDSGLGSFACKIVQQETVLAEATINVYEPPAEQIKEAKTIKQQAN
ncbi:MAG: 3-hydroxylacyl-ACP dehydratase [Burkholderiaceae bacterium]|nr:MAG: 3-hydroxylacyl-ACP dehydratase [Burkholderiaceae bacterium]